MNPWHAVLLAVVQGITEFIPVSSSAHLILVPFFLGWKDQGLDFDIATNTGTLIAVLVYFRQDVRDLVVGFFTNQPRSTQAGGDGDGHPSTIRGRLAWAITLGTIPAGIAGLLIHDWVETQARNPLLIAGTSIRYGLLLLLADRLGRKERTLGRPRDLRRSAHRRGAGPRPDPRHLALRHHHHRRRSSSASPGPPRPASRSCSGIPIGVLVALKSAKTFWRHESRPRICLPMAIGVVVSAVVGYAGDRVAALLVAPAEPDGLRGLPADPAAR